MSGMTTSTLPPGMPSSSSSGTMSSMPMPTMDAMAGMDMGGGDGPACKISMLWNWNTIDTCFLSSTWHVRSRGAFGGLCIGVILLVILLEFLRRAAQAYDRFLLVRQLPPSAAAAAAAEEGKRAEAGGGGHRPTPAQQAARALLHTLQFAVAYWVMLLAMYYNGFVILCIFIGAYIGFFVFRWERLGGLRDEGPDSHSAAETTGCCG
ncbi:Ctr copper transporter family-domain-containing protein [Xylariomycetidae sp. FL0641]|nr:Ctr copper transporter family-domain-containing protein [Xylariomycetidae sp. FL0641]